MLLMIAEMHFSRMLIVENKHSQARDYISSNTGRLSIVSYRSTSDFPAIVTRISYTQNYLFAPLFSCYVLDYLIKKAIGMTRKIE